MRGVVQALSRYRHSLSDVLRIDLEEIDDQALIVVASGLPLDAAPDGWTRIQGSGYAYRMLDPDRRP